jgi:hypothetical protein
MKLIYPGKFKIPDNLIIADFETWVICPGYTGGDLDNYNMAGLVYIACKFTGLITIDNITYRFKNGYQDLKYKHNETKKPG